MTKQAGRRYWVQAGLALGLGLLLAEGALQLASLVVGRRADAWLAGERVDVLAVGDSHTYGLPLPAADSYPAQLEARLRERHPGREWRVANLGVPGANSAFVANRLERQIVQLAPRLVIVWVGINNYWNVVEVSEAEAAGAGPGGQNLGASFWQSLRLYRLAALLFYNATGHRYDARTRGGWFEGEQPPSAGSGSRVPQVERPPGLARDLTRMTKIARSLETPILFITYPLPSQHTLRQEALRLGGRLSVPVVDAAESRVRARRDGHSDDALVDTRQGAHPSALLYRYLVDDLLVFVEPFLGLDPPELGLDPPESEGLPRSGEPAASDE